MNFLALESWKLMTLMAAGGVFAAVGLFLLLRPAKSDGLAKIELFGLKFQSSSAGVLIFLVGTVFISVPIFVPERAAATQSASGSQATGAQTVSGTVGTNITIEALEEEPNNSLANANMVLAGSTIRGEAHDYDFDYFCVDTEGSASVLFTLTKNSGTTMAISAYKRDGAILRSSNYIMAAESFPFEIAGNNDVHEYCMLVRPNGDGKAAYTLTVSTK